MKKIYSTSANVAARTFKLDKNFKASIECTPKQCIDIVEKAIKIGYKVIKEVQRFPYDREFPYLSFSEGHLTASKEHSSTILTFSEAMKCLNNYNPPVTIKLSEEYDAVVSNDGVKVGCKEFEFDAIEKLYKAVKERMEK